jgi:murein tripeptide amidase MpaA
MAVVDARKFLVNKEFISAHKSNNTKSELSKHYHSKPAVLITGQHHSRGVITSSMVLFSMLKMLHGGIVHNNLRDVKLLLQNKYFVLPSINVDGVAYIEDNYKSKGVLLDKRTNMHIQNNKCGNTKAGVDLNRNYGHNFGIGDSTSVECSGDNYRGQKAFSEPETQAMKNFLTQKKDELKFVYNFHCAGK